MRDFVALLRNNRNYRYLWFGQIISELGDHFNTIAVFHLALELTGSGLVVSGVMLSRALAMVSAGPLAGIALDRTDRRHLMILSDLFRAIVAALFILCLVYRTTWSLYALSAMLMFASPFFTSGRASILPVIASRQELHTANALTQTTQWTALTLGTLLGGTSVMGFGYHAAFSFNALSFVISAACIARLQVAGGFRPARRDLSEDRVLRPWREYSEGLRYMKSVPLLLALGLLHVGWASGGGAAQILFSLFGEKVFLLGAAGTGFIWSSAGLGLLAGAPIAHWLGPRLKFQAYLWIVAGCYLVHGITYAAFSQMPTLGWACFFIGLSRTAVAITSVLNMSQLLRHVADTYRGRVFSTIESMNWGTMMFSMTAAGVASDYYSPREIGLVAGLLSGSTAFFWAWAVWRGKIPEPPEIGIAPKEVEVHGDPTG
jgi:MFS family permease